MGNNGKEEALTPKKVGAVMVVGGGITGMQSALDLANSGFKVYLVEEKSSIGGRMAQLDKTFPTNDCSMCMISPKLIEVSKHNNIELLTNTTVESLEGEPGRFTVKLTKKPRYIDITKCSGCGDCAEACPVKLENEFDMGLSGRKAAFRTFPQAVPGAFAIEKNGHSPCKITCPANINVQGYVQLIKKKEYLKAVNLIRERNPLSAICGRVCTHPCEAKCTRNSLDEAVAIRLLKRFASDKEMEMLQAGKISLPEEKTPPPGAKKVAVIGAGPSGLTAADDLACRGFAVTVYEASSNAGGMLRWGIPQYRLPSNILDYEVELIRRKGVKFVFNCRAGKDISINKLRQDYDAVFIGAGAQMSRKLGVPGEDKSGVLHGIEFLRQAGDINNLPQMKKRVLVIGGGNVAVDVARTALRLGAKMVDMVCLEKREEMPALPEEVKATLEEGIVIHNGWGPNRILGNGTVTGVEFKQCTTVFDKDGRFSPVYNENQLTTLEADQVIIAIGQAVDKQLITETGIEAERGSFKTDPLTQETRVKGVFAGGDCASGPASVIQAVAAGKRAAESIARYLKNEDMRGARFEEALKPLPEELLPSLKGKEKRPRSRPEELPVAQRSGNFKEVEGGLTEEAALAEAERCLNCAVCSECLQCVAVCQAKAIDHAMREETASVEVGSVVVAPGFEPFDARIRGEYGYGRMPNVVTSLEFERILSASGPFKGQIVRPSDGKHPVKIAWIQCVGSRDETCGRDYCSSVCCMYATKEAIIAREHDSSIEPTIFYNDIRAYGKGFERYYESAKSNFGVKYVKGIPSTIKELQQSKNLLLEFTGEDGQKVQEEFGMVVLSIGMVPSAGTRELAQKLGLELDRFGFCQTDEFQPNATSRPGIYVAGAFNAPMDIPESVVSASSAACLASQEVAEARGTMVREKVYPDEIKLDSQEPRVGVFICRCGANIARIVNVADIAEYAKTLPYVVHAEENLYTCSTDTQKKIIDVINKEKLNRVVVASCSPRTHEPLFQDTLREAGLNKYLFEMANIRDQCSWVHATHIPQANDKAKDLVRMAVARSATLQPLHELTAEIKHSALVIGGGLAGMTAALGIASQGYEAVLVERDKELGGNLRHVFYSLDGSDPQKLASSLIKQVESNPRIRVFKNAEIKEVSGYIGNYKTTVRAADGRTEEINHGVMIVATGATQYKPVEYFYGKSNKVVTQSELEAQMAAGDKSVTGAKSVVMIQCVGSREKEHMYCSRLCCSQAIKNAILLKDQNPDTEVYVLYRDIRSYGMRELKYKEARKKGVIFIRYEADRKPEVSEDAGKLKVKVFDAALGADVQLQPDLVVLSAAVRPQADATDFASKLKLPLNQDGFFMEAHMKLRPLDFVNEGIYLCGLAHAPKSISESITQAQAAVSRALTVLSKPTLKVSGVISVVDKERCVACLTCVRSCPFNVPKINGEGIAEIEAAACQGCGICAAACPRKAIKLQHYSDEQVIAKTAVLCGK